MPAQPAVCLLRLLFACSAFYMPQYSRAYCVPAQPSICHNTTEPIVCLLSLLYATIQPSLLCACSTFYMPQYSRAYCVPAQPSICHNTDEPTICLLSLLYATIQYKYCNTIFPQPAYLYCNTIPATHCNTIFPLHTSILQYNFLANKPPKTCCVTIQCPIVL